MSKQYEAVNDFLMYLWNASGDEFLLALFGERYDEMERYKKGYIQKFLDAKRENPASIWSMLDRSNQQKLLDAANERYNRGDEEDCEHLNYTDTMLGAVCLDCGLGEEE